MINNKYSSLLYNNVGKTYKSVSKFFTWLYYGRKYSCPLYPFEIIYVCPEKIKYVYNKPDIVKPASSGVVGGDWDVDYYPKEFKTNFEISMKSHIFDNIPWEETSYYEDLLQSPYYDTHSESEILSKLQSYVDLYHTIKKNGYKNQAELPKTEKVSTSIHESPIPMNNEITIDIGRDGQYIWFGGNHRLVIARILGIEKIPVRVRVRHHEWQLKRDKIYNGEIKAECRHPDIISNERV